MSTTFNPVSGLVVVHVRIHGPTGEAIARLALDTGATTTLVSEAILVAAGCDPPAATSHIDITTGSSVVRVPRVAIPKFVALGLERDNFPIVAHTLPPTASVDGVLGLDFMRGLCLTVDFRAGRVVLA